MPKILFLLLLSSISIGQTLANQVQIEKDILNSIEIKSFINEFDKSNSVIINLQLNKNNEKKSIDHSEQNSELFFQDIGNIEEISENKVINNYEKKFQVKLKDINFDNKKISEFKPVFEKNFNSEKRDYFFCSKSINWQKITNTYCIWKCHTRAKWHQNIKWENNLL